MRYRTQDDDDNNNTHHIVGNIGTFMSDNHTNTSNNIDPSPSNAVSRTPTFPTPRRRSSLLWPSLPSTALSTSSISGPDAVHALDLRSIIDEVLDYSSNPLLNYDSQKGLTTRARNENDATTYFPRRRSETDVEQLQYARESGTTITGMTMFVRKSFSTARRRKWGLNLFGSSNLVNPNNDDDAQTI